MTTDSTTTIVPCPLWVVLPPSWIMRTPVCGPGRASRTGTLRRDATVRSTGSSITLSSLSGSSYPHMLKFQSLMRSLARSASRELRSHVTRPDVAVLDVEEVHVVQWHACSGQQVPGSSLIVGVLHGKVHLDVAAHRADHVAHRLGGGEPRLVFERWPEHPHGLVALILAGKEPVGGSPVEAFKMGDGACCGKAHEETHDDRHNSSHGLTSRRRHGHYLRSHSATPPLAVSMLLLLNHGAAHKR